MKADSIVDEDDAVLAATLAVLDGEAPQGTENIRRGETEDGAAFVYWVDPDAEGDVYASWVTVDGDSLHSDAAMWVANREEVERKADDATSRGRVGPRRARRAGVV